MPAIFYGVGLGPGDPELLTIKAVKAIEQADVIIAPITEKDKESIVLSIAKEYINENSELIKIFFPMSYQQNNLSESWDKSKKIILEKLQMGKKVAFLTLGDPMLYSTYIYLYRLLKDSGYKIENIAGVNAFSAVSSKLGYPLAEGEDVLTVVPGTIDEESLDAILQVSDNLVLMKVSQNYQQLLEKLKQFGLLTNAVLVSNCGLENEKIIDDLTKVDKEKIDYLSTIIVRRFLNGDQTR